MLVFFQIRLRSLNDPNLTADQKYDILLAIWHHTLAYLYTVADHFYLRTLYFEGKDLVYKYPVTSLITVTSASLTMSVFIWFLCFSMGVLLIGLIVFAMVIRKYYRKTFPLVLI